MGGRLIKKRQAVMAVIGAANRDPERFPDPDKLDIGRTDNRHLAFGWASHFCFGAPLARIEGQLVFEGLVRRTANMKITPGPIVWRDNLGLRGLTSLQVTFDSVQSRFESPAIVTPVASATGCPFHGASYLSCKRFSGTAGVPPACERRTQVSRVGA